MKNWSVTLWTPGAQPKDDGSTFGCAVHGFCTPTRWVDPGAGETARWDRTLKGELLGGSYSRVLQDLKGVGFKPSAAIALFVRNSGVEGFIDSCRKTLPDVPMAGGVAALGKGQTEGEVLPKTEDVTLLLLGAARYAAECECEAEYAVEATNVHDPKGVQVEIRRGEARLIDEIRAGPKGEWKKAADYYSSLREKGRVPEDDYESITFSDLGGVNVHCSAAIGGLKTGANLPENGALLLRETDTERVTSRIRDWVSAENTLAFCCAGLRRLVRAPLHAGKGSLAGFMFGEVVTMGNRPAFGNLMAARLRVVCPRRFHDGCRVREAGRCRVAALTELSSASRTPFSRPHSYMRSKEE
jgi:hypothetical protein